ncbi:MAG: cysteine desulfurase-like protein [Planctomycetaceae bacterium]
MLPLDDVRGRFPALLRTMNGEPVAYFDGPAGSQTPQRVADAVARYLLRTNANRGGRFATAVESDELLDDAQRILAAFLGTGDQDCLAFGPNMTTLTFALSRALGAGWSPGDEVLVTRLDHDANVSPWALAARDAGANVGHVDVHPEDCTLDMDDFTAKLSDRTKLVAVAYASNAVGTINPLAEIIAKSHAAGALVFVDAVHYAPHGLIDVTELDCDFLACSAYKFFGPHVGVLYGRRELLEETSAYKLRPATDELPDKWMTGTQSHEGIAGAAEAVRYLADVGRSIEPAADLRSALAAAFSVIETHERDLAAVLLRGLAELPAFRVWGIAEGDRMHERVPTVSVTHASRTPAELASALGQRGLFAWHGNHYALPLTEALGLEPGGTLRIGLLHYNTAHEVDRLLGALRELA